MEAGEALAVLLSPAELLLGGRVGGGGVVVLDSPAELLLEKGQKDLGGIGILHVEVVLLSLVSWAVAETTLLGLKKSLILKEYLNETLGEIEVVESGEDLEGDGEGLGGEEQGELSTLRLTEGLVSSVIDGEGLGSSKLRCLLAMGIR